MTRDALRGLLTVENRCLPGAPDRLMLGPTGKRLWMDYLDPAPGFSGRADFIHKANLPLLFSVLPENREALPRPVRARWRPDESLVSSSCPEFTFTERKLITWEDQALSLQTWRNLTDRPLTLRLVLPPDAAWDAPYPFPCRIHGVTPVMCMAGSVPWPENRLTLAPGEERQLLLAAALGLPGEEAAMKAGLEALVRAPDLHRLMDEKADENLGWFDQAPGFSCGDRRITACWYYRIYLLRKNFCAPGLGRLPGPCFFEGRSHRMVKTPMQPQGWEFSRLIPLSTPLHVTDARWLRQSGASQAALRALLHSEDENGMFAVTSADTAAKAYAHYAAWALYLDFLIRGDLAFLRETLPAFKREARKVYEACRRGDHLQIERVHALTGKEYQPSFWYFTDQRYPASVRPAREGYTPLKRVDRSVYMYLNFTGLSRLCRAAGDPEADAFAAEAEGIRRDILDKMWDDETKCFYDLHFETDEKALVKNIVAFDPFWAGITGEEHLPALAHLLNPALFSLGSGFASAAADCPVFSPDGGWRGDYFKGPHGCMWNGPSWPFSTCIALDALAAQSKAHGHRYDAAFEKGLAEYTRQHFSPDGRPMLVEFYNSRTGQPLSEEADYLHSFYLDLVIRHLAGIEPREEGVYLHPLDTGLSDFELSGAEVRGHRIDVCCHKASGYAAFVDGERRYQGKRPENALLFSHGKQAPP